MQWSDGPGAGFTTGTPWQPPNRNYTEINVAAQETDPDSLLNHYRSLVHLRNQHPVLRAGDYLRFTSNCLQLYPVLRVEGNQAMILLANLGRREMEDCTLSISESPLAGQYEVTLLFGKGDFGEITFGEDGSLSDYPLPGVIQPFQHFMLQVEQP
jgi:glycosidase